MIQEPGARANYEHMSELMNELSLYIMFGLGFVLVRYASELLFILLSKLIFPLLYDTSQLPGKPSSNSRRLQENKSSLEQFLRRYGCCHLTGAVQVYNTYIKSKGIGKNETPFNVLEHMKEQDIVPDIATYNTLLDLCFTEGRIDVALELFHNCCTSDSDVRPDVVTFNTYIKGLLIRYNKGEKQISEETVAQVMRDMSLFGVKPNDITYNTTIDLCIATRSIKAAWRYFAEMKERGITPDLFTYSILVKGLKDAPQDSKQNFDSLFESIENYIVAHKEELDEILFNSLIDTAVYYKDFGKVNRTLEHMKDKGIKPSNVTYGILIKAFGQNGMIENALLVFEQMKKNSIEPNEVTYGCIIDGCIRAAKYVEAQAFLHEMNSKNIPTNIVIYTTLLKGYARRRDFRSIWEMYEKIALRREIEPNIVFFNAILESLVQCQRPELLMVVYQKIRTEDPRRIRPDVITYSTLIKGLCKAHDMDTVLELYEAMKQECAPLDEALYNSIMHGLIVCGKFADCARVYQEMQTAGVPASNVTHSIMVKLYTKTAQFDKAVELYDALMGAGKDPGVVFHTCVLQACIKSKRVAKAVEVFEGLRKRTPDELDQVVYNTIVNGCVYAGMLAKACAYTHWAMEDGVTLAPDIYNNVVKNILTSRTMEMQEKRTNVKRIVQYCEANEVEISEELCARAKKLLTGSRLDVCGKKKDFYYIPKRTPMVEMELLLRYSGNVVGWKRL